ncbi:MAG: hypothetical protein ACO32O_08160 [Ilumatobacteraceae bacterium]
MTRVIVVDDLKGLQAADLQSSGTPRTIVVSWNTFFDGSPAPFGADVIHLGDALHDQEDSLQQALLHWLATMADKHTSADSPLPFVYPNLHSWWLLKISEKNYATTPEFTTLLKLSLLRDVCEQHDATSCDYLGGNPRLESAVAGLVVGLRLPTNARTDALRVSFRERLEVLQAIFHFAKAFGVAIANLFRQRPTRQGTSGTTRLANQRMLGFVGYLLPAANPTRAHSPYWGPIRESFRTGQHSTWLYHRSDEVSLRDGRTFCTTSSSDTEFHCLIDDFITMRVVVRGIASYRKLARARKTFSLDVPRSSSALGDLGAERLFSTAIRDSLSGSHAVWSILQAHAYESLMQTSRVTRWFFLWENKAFEQSLVSAAQRSGAIETVGYAHSVVRQRDHRYYNELRMVPVVGVRVRPTASLYVVNGPHPLDSIKRIGAPEAPLRLVEALRYLSLSPRRPVSAYDVLVVGDISSDESRRLVVALVEALRSLNGTYRIIFKPHPGNLSQSEMARGLGCEVTTAPLSEVAPSLAFAVVGVAGAASLDLTMLEVPVVTLLDARTSNLSPLAGVSGAVFARTSDDLRRFAQGRLSGSADTEFNTDVKIDVDTVMTRTRPPERWAALLNGLL